MKYAYVRNSLNDAESLNGQYEVIRSEVDDIATKYSAWDELISSLQAGDEVIVCSADRVSKEPSEYEHKKSQIEDKGATLVVLNPGEAQSLFN